ncbi:MAG: Multidrug resistance protein MdtA [Elusimicrobia bacterium]|nr:Multidrug resistance protein MdtA [Elusimicrobiota bacterium]
MKTRVDPVTFEARRNPILISNHHLKKVQPFLKFFKTHGQWILWGGLPLLLLILNFARDLSHLEKKYEWERLTIGTLHRGVSATGVMEAVDVADIKSEVSEIVEKKLIKEGQTVAVGQPLLELSRAKTLLEHEQKKTAHASIEAEYKKAVRELSVQRSLLKNMAVSRQQVEDAEQAVEKTKSALSISKQEMTFLDKKLASTLVRSPIKGVVLKDFTKLGLRVSEGNNLITVGDISKFVVRTKVDELDINQVRVGQPVDVMADAFSGIVMRGKVLSIATQAERETFAKFEVVIEIVDSGGLELKHNLSVRVNIVTEDIPDTLSVPIKSVIKKEGDNGWVVAKNRFHLISKRRVKLGLVGGDRIQVLKGLKPRQWVGYEKITLDES